MAKQSEIRAVAPATSVAVVIPCYCVTGEILAVIEKVPALVSRIIVVDDGCPDGTGDYVERHCTDARIEVCRHESNQGVGAAMITGYRHALAADADIVVKIDGDGQMDPALLPRLIAPIVEGRADYVKGNRFYHPEDVQNMPAVRLIGNIVLSFFSKFSTGYWTIFDSNNGYVAIHAAILKILPLDKIAKGYFFESDMLFRLYTVRALVAEMPMNAVYQDEKSNLHALKSIGPFLLGHLKNFHKRYVYCYLLRDFSVASIEWALGPALLIFGVVFGILEWLESLRTGVVASAGTVMLSALPIVVGTQMLIAAIGYDIRNVPPRAIHRDLTDLDDDARLAGLSAQASVPSKHR